MFRNILNVFVLIVRHVTEVGEDDKPREEEIELGVSGVVTTAVPVLDESLTNHNVGQGIHVVPNRYYAMSGAHMSGGSVDWILISMGVVISGTDVNKKKKDTFCFLFSIFLLFFYF